MRLGCSVGETERPLRLRRLRKNDQVSGLPSADNGRMTSQPGRVLSVNVLHQVIDAPTRPTAIDKRPVEGAVEVSELGLVTDTQCDTRFHGGVDKAVYAYAAEDSVWWSQQLGREVPPGQFGENLTVAGVEVTNAVIGELWRVGGPRRGILLEVRLPRTPCANLAWHMGIARFHQTLDKSGRVGAMLRVRAGGLVRAGASVRVERRPAHGVTVRQVSDRLTPEQARALLDSGLDLAVDLRGLAERRLARSKH